MFHLAFRLLIATLALLASSASFSAPNYLCGNYTSYGVDGAGAGLSASQWRTQWLSARGCVLGSGSASACNGQGGGDTVSCSSDFRDSNRDPSSGDSPIDPSRKKCASTHSEVSIGTSSLNGTECRSCLTGSGLYNGSSSSCETDPAGKCTDAALIYDENNSCISQCPPGKDPSLDRNGNRLCRSNPASNACGITLGASFAAVGLATAVGCAKGGAAGSAVPGPGTVGGCAAGAIAGVVVSAIAATAACSSGEADPSSNPPPISVRVLDESGNVVSSSTGASDSDQGQIDCRIGIGCYHSPEQVQDWNLTGSGSSQVATHEPSGAVCTGGVCSAPDGDGGYHYVGELDGGGGIIVGNTSGSTGGTSTGATGTEHTVSSDGVVTHGGTTTNVVINSDVAGAGGGGSSGGGSSGGGSSGGGSTGGGAGSGGATGSTACGSLACESTLAQVRDALVDSTAAVQSSYSSAVSSAMQGLDAVKSDLLDAQSDSNDLVDQLFSTLKNPLHSLTDSFGNCTVLDYPVQLSGLPTVRLKADVCGHIDVIHWAILSLVSMAAAFYAFDLLFKES